MAWKGWTNGILGFWLFITAFLGFSANGNLWNDLIVGIAVAVVGFAMVQEKSWQGWTSGILGLWLIIAAFIPNLVGGAGLVGNNIIVGLAVAIAGFAALGRGKSSRMAGDVHEKMAH
jgi:hypothetical protein